MHEKNIYDPEAPDVKILPLIKSLRKGTEIEVCEPHQSKVFQNRTTDRIFFLAKDMVAKGLITMQENPPQKIPLFREFWINRHSEYGPKETVTKTAATIERPDVFSTEYLPPDRGSNFRTPTAKMVSKGPQKSSTTTVRTRLHSHGFIELSLTCQPRPRPHSSQGPEENMTFLTKVQSQTSSSRRSAKRVQRQQELNLL